MKRTEYGTVLTQEHLTEEILSMWLQVTFAGEVKAGQFISLVCADGSRLLPRPISICDADPEGGKIRLVYRTAGEGTREFAALSAGGRIRVMGPLGNGFPLDAARGRRVLFVGGGIGIPPMVLLAKKLRALSGPDAPAAMTHAVGYRSKDMYLLRELEESAETIVSTDDGSYGVRGTVLDAIRSEGVSADVIYACGPKVMLRALKEYAAERNIRCFVSMEERMACGIGVCLGCVTGTTCVNAHYGVKNARVCADGPVFDAREVDLT